MPIPRGLTKKYAPQKTAPVKDWLEGELAPKICFIMGAASGVFHASSVGKDARLLFLEFTGRALAEEIDVTQARKMNAGTALHGMWKEHLQKSGFLIDAERNVTPHPMLPLRGRLDFIVKNVPENQLFLLELKTTGALRWRGLTEPDFMALAQWGVYSEREQIALGYIIYYDTDAQKPKYFLMSREGNSVKAYYKGIQVAEWPDLVSKIYEKLTFVRWCAQASALPERCFGCRAQRCGQIEVCKNLETEQKTMTLDEWRRDYGSSLRESS